MQLSYFLALLLVALAPAPSMAERSCKIVLEKRKTNFPLITQGGQFLYPEEEEDGNRIVKIGTATAAGTVAAPATTTSRTAAEAKTATILAAATTCHTCARGLGGVCVGGGGGEEALCCWGVGFWLGVGGVSFSETHMTFI